MKKINWKRKLSSRKFWVAISGLITALLVAFKIDSLTVEQVVAIVSAMGTLVAFILGESYVDGKGVEKNGDIKKN